MNLSPEQLLENYTKFTGYINTYITGNRKNQLLDFYKKIEDRLVVYPASNNIKYHSCFEGGYLYHVNRVIESSLYLTKLYEKMGADMTTFTQEELVFSAINHDLGKIGSTYEDIYLPSKDQWRKDNLGELYTFNTKIPFMSVPDRGLFLLQQAEISVSQNEWIAIKTHDHLFDQANEAYIKPFTPEARYRTVMPVILQHADQLSAVIEFENQYQKEIMLKKK